MSSDMKISSMHTQSPLSLGGVKTRTLETDDRISSGVMIEDTLSLSSHKFLERVTQIQGFLEQISSAETVISTSLDHIDTIIAKLEELGGIAVRARDILDSSIAQDLLTPQLKELNQRFALITQDIDNLAQNAGFPDENLLAGDTVSFEIDPSDTSQLNVEGAVISSAEFGLEQISFTQSPEARYVKTLVLQAIDQVTLLRSQLRASSYELSTRKEFSEDTISVFIAQAQNEDALTRSDEGDSLRDLQIRLNEETQDYLAFEAQFELLEHFK